MTAQGLLGKVNELARRAAMSLQVFSLGRSVRGSEGESAVIPVEVIKETHGPPLTQPNEKISGPSHSLNNEHLMCAISNYASVASKPVR